ncbi:MAG: hypothetical protein CME88_13395 [Hirschia sp.]|nr:hypothetical protein [Hirschia sp.]MBF19365.1 hypothetical protein [Hirschia sp.]
MTFAADKPTIENAELAAGRKRSARVPWFDGARGYLLTMMYLAHYTFTLNTPIIWLHHGWHIPVMDGEFFVLISGFVCALAYYGAHKKNGMKGSFLSVMSRLKWVYVYQVAVSILMIFIFRYFGDTEVQPYYRADFNTPLLQQFISVLQLRTMPPYLNILMLYMALMLFIPLAFAALEKGWRWRYLAVIAGLWIFVELGWHTQLDHVIRSVFPYQKYIGLMGYFQPLTYATLFYGAFMLGYFSRKGVKIAETGPARLRPSLFYASLFILALGVLGYITWRLKLIPVELAVPQRQNLSIQGIVTTFAASYAIWFLIARDGLNPVFDKLSAATRWFFSIPVFQMLGKNSLFVYSMHVVAMFLAAYVVIILGFKDSLIGKLAGLAGGYAFLVAITWAKNRFLPNLP